jgi:L-malate glycosyltransferase
MKNLKNKKVLFLSPYPFGVAPSQRLKYEQYVDYFEAQGYDVKTSSFVTKAFWKVIYKKGFFLQKILFTLLGYAFRCRDLFRLRKYDVVYVHLWVTPLGLPFFEFMVLLIAKKVVYDIDDLVFLHQGNQVNTLASALKGRNKSLYLIKHAHYVITCTPYLFDLAIKKNKYHKAIDISSTIDTEKYQPIRPEDRTSDLVSIGWTGTHSTSRYLYLLTGVLQQLAKLRPFKLVVIGSNFECQMEGVKVEMIQWTAESEVADLQKIDIGLYPLSLDNWVMGKSGLKALQYMALGIPTVATDFGTIGRIITHNTSGLLVKTDEEWLQALIELIDSPQRRIDLGKNGRKVIDERFSILVNRDRYLSVLEEVTQ